MKTALNFLIGKRMFLNENEELGEDFNNEEPVYPDIPVEILGVVLTSDLIDENDAIVAPS